MNDRQAASGSGPSAADALVQLLRRLRGRAIRLGGGAGLSWGLAGALIFAICSAWIDLVFDLSPQLRITALAASVIAGLLLLGRVFGRVLGMSRTSMLARRLDQLGKTGGQILSGADLVTDKKVRSPLSRGLARMAIDRAAFLAGITPAARAVSARPLWIASGSVGVVVAGAAIIALLAPRMVSTEYLRFTDPFGDHPPYSRVSFRVEPGDGQVIYGAHQEIRVVTSGPPVDRLELVVSPSDSQNQTDGPPAEETLPMFGEPGNVWRATIAGVTSPTTYFVRCDEGRSHRFRLGVITLPRIEAVRFRIIPPAYTHRGAYEGGLPQGGLAGLPGTKVQVWARSNRPLGGGSMRITFQRPGAEPVRVAMQPSASGDYEVNGGFEIRRPGRLELRIRDVDRQESQDAFVTTVAVLKDERPFVRLLDPPAVSLATPGVAVPVALAAEDDYGISRLSLYRSLNDSRAIPVDFDLPPDPPATRQNQVSGLPLPAYGLRPGDEIKLFARVEDNDPAAAKGSESPLALVRIISQEDYQRLVLTRQGLEVLMAKYEQARRRMEDIAARIEELQKQFENQQADDELSEKMRKEISDLAAKMKQESQEIARSAEAKLPFDVDEKMTEHLRTLADKLRQAAEAVDEFARTEPRPRVGEAREGLETIRKFCQGNRREYEQKTTEPLEYMAKVYPLLEDQARFVALYKRQKELADRLSSLKGRDSGDDPQLRARMRDLEAEQFKIREDLKMLLDDIEDHVQQLPENPELDQLRETASAFLIGVRESGAAEAMSDAEAGLAAFSGTRGAESAREAEEILRQFIGRCQSMGNQGSMCLKFAPGLGENLGNSIEQLLAGAGLGMGPNGMGLAGGGYSAGMSTLDNVGLYGQLPALGGGLDREGKDSSAALLATGGHEGNFESGEPGRVDPLDPLRAMGAVSNLVPPQYRQQVGQYFQRVADELGESPEARNER